MGSFKQHMLWNALTITVFNTLILTLLVGDFFFTFLFATILFLIGGIIPDIDLPHKRWFTVMFTGIVIPIIGFFIVKRSTHWGKVHSIGFGMLFTSFLSFFIVFVSLLSGNEPNIIQISLLSGAFFSGFMCHLIGDQLYHEYHGKQDYRVALKLWSNNWWFDPLIRIYKVF